MSLEDLASQAGMSLEELNNALAGLSNAANQSLDAAQRELAMRKKFNDTSQEFTALQKKISDLTKKKYDSELKALKDLAKGADAETKKKIRAQVKEIAGLRKLDKAIAEQGATLHNATRVMDKLNTKRKQDIEIMERTGGVLDQAKARWGKFIDQFKKDPGAKLGAAGAASVGISIAKDPMAVVTQMAGPWGMLLQFIIETIDGVRKLAGEMSTASAASGKFGTSMKNARQEANRLAQGQAEFAAQGFEISEISNIYSELKNTGLEALGIIPKIPGQLSDAAKGVIAFSKASGEASQVVAERFASMQRNFGITMDETMGEYDNILSAAQDAADRGITTTAAYMQTVQSLAEAFTDTGASIQGVNSIVSTVGRTMQQLGRPLNNLNKVAQGIMGITKASEGWQVFMARMSGMQGGYAQSLFKMQQRGPGGALPKAGEMDPMQYVKAAKNMLLKPTAGIADQETRQLMIERLGSQLGMDTETTQIFQKMSAGKISATQAGRGIDDLWKEAKKNSMTQKGMFDIIKNILTGLIAKPILWIYELLQKILGSVDETSADDTIAAALGGAERSEFDARRGRATGLGIPQYVKNAGFVRVHADEVIAGKKSYPMATTEPMATGKGSGGGINMSFNMSIDQRSLKRSFEEMERKTYAALTEQQNRNYVG